MPCCRIKTHPALALQISPLLLPAESSAPHPPLHSRPQHPAPYSPLHHAHQVGPHPACYLALIHPNVVYNTPTCQEYVSPVRCYIELMEQVAHRGQRCKVEPQECVTCFSQPCALQSSLQPAADYCARVIRLKLTGRGWKLTSDIRSPHNLVITNRLWFVPAIMSIYGLHLSHDILFSLLHWASASFLLCIPTLEFWWRTTHEMLGHAASMPWVE
jgi:hypothetical protein